MTVYYQFQSRERLLDAFADHLAERGGLRRMPEVFLEPDPERALRLLVEIFVGFWATDRLALRRVRAMGVIAPSRDSGPRDRDAWRREAIETLLRRFGRRSRAGVSPSSANLVAVLTTLTGFETFDSLCVDGRTPDRVAALIGRMALNLIRSGEP